MSIVSCCICSQPANVPVAKLGSEAEMTALCRGCNRAIATAVYADVWARDSLGCLHTVDLPGAA